jgi:hypothetical protein
VHALETDATRELAVDRYVRSLDGVAQVHVVLRMVEALRLAAGRQHLVDARHSADVGTDERVRDLERRCGDEPLACPNGIRDVERVSRRVEHHDSAGEVFALEKRRELRCFAFGPCT